MTTLNNCQYPSKVERKFFREKKKRNKKMSTKVYKKNKGNTEEIVLKVDDDCENWKDGGRGWMICFAAAMVQFVVLGIHNSFGILYIVFVKEYGWSKALTGKG